MVAAFITRAATITYTAGATLAALATTRPTTAANTAAASTTLPVLAVAIALLAATAPTTAIATLTSTATGTSKAATTRPVHEQRSLALRLLGARRGEGGQRSSTDHANALRTVIAWTLEGRDAAVAPRPTRGGRGALCWLLRVSSRITAEE